MNSAPALPALTFLLTTDDAGHGAAFARALAAQGHAATVQRVPATQDAMRAAWLAAGADELLVIDGGLLPTLAALAQNLPPRRAAALIASAEDDHARFARLAPLIGMVLAADEMLAARLRDAGGPRVAVVMPGTQDAPRAVGTGQTPGCAILSVGALLPRTGHDIVLRALARLPDLDWSLRIVGDAARDAAYARSLQDLPAALGVAARVRFLPDTMLETAWAGTDLLAMASQREQHAFLAADALRRGIPVAAIACGAVEALVPQGAGAVCAPGDWEGLSKTLRRIIFDDGLRASMADAAWQAGQALPGWDRQAALLADTLRHL